MLLTLLLSLLPVSENATDADHAILDTLSGSVLVTSVKQPLPVEMLASPVSTMYLKDIEDAGIESPKNLSSLVPNLNIPDYGSSMTSTIYLRGFGSRMDNPVMGLYIDGIPILNKSSYDFDMMDIRRLDLLRGPQGTLYGRNSLCGVLAVGTVSPSLYQGVRAHVEYGSANTVSAGVSAYGKALCGLAIGGMVSYRHTDGYYTNEYTGEKCDASDALSFRLRLEKELVPGLFFENILSASALTQGGWPYRHLEDGVLHPVSYNDPSSYKRLNVTEGLIFRYLHENFSLNSVTSWQFLMDDMRLDQDFTPASMFTLRQTQDEHAVTQELVLKPENSWRTSWWNWQTGITGFFRHNSMSAPVTFKEDGIRTLIEDNVNSVFQNPSIPFRMQFDITDGMFDISSDFILRSWNAAIYHESYFSVGKWLFTAGLRLDYEGSSMDYGSRAAVNYSLSPFFEGRPFSTEYIGKVTDGHFEFIPKLSVLYDFGDLGGLGGLRLFAVASKGYRAGGFNTQIFSDILQNMMTAGMMADAMGTVMPSGGGSNGAESGGAVTAENTVYGPESSFNHEIGGNFDLSLQGRTGVHRIEGAASAFYIACRDQQMTVFPPGQSTGRMMANVGRSRSIGAEAWLNYAFKGFHASLSYGFTDARFVEYDDGSGDWSGNRIPYSPSSTLHVRAGYRFPFNSGVVRSLSLAADASGAGRIWWNESNTLSTPFHIAAGADISLSFKMFSLVFRADNINCTEYEVFYFRSVGNDFFQTSKPFRWSVALRLEI